MRCCKNEKDEKVEKNQYMLGELLLKSSLLNNVPFGPMFYLFAVFGLRFFVASLHDATVRKGYPPTSAQRI